MDNKFKSCATCAHSSHYTVTGDILCLGPAPIVFCEGMDFTKEDCEFWEAEEEEENDGE